MAEGDVVAVVAATPPSEGRDNWHNDASYAAAERVDGGTEAPRVRSSARAVSGEARELAGGHREVLSFVQIDGVRRALELKRVVEATRAPPGLLERVREAARFPREAPQPHVAISG